MQPLRLRLLSGFGLTAGGAAVVLALSAQRVLAFLALHEGSVQRAFVAGSLWLDHPEDRAHANLRTALWRLRACGFPLVETCGLQLRLADDVVIDVRTAELHARTALGGCDDAVELEAAMFTSDLLPDWYDDWLILERERFRQVRLHALDALCERLIAAGRFDEALDAGMASIACEPLRESAHRAVVRLHLAEGNVGEAIRQYTLCARLLHEGLGIAPSASMEALIAPRRPAIGLAARSRVAAVQMR